MRGQLALHVRDLDAAIRLYSKIFGVAVQKRQPGYANFAIAQPPLKRVLFERPDAPERLNHLGVEVCADAEVEAATERFKSAGMDHKIASEAICCWAKQHTVITHDPDGMMWEWYRVVEDAATLRGTPVASAYCTPQVTEGSRCLLSDEPVLTPTGSSARALSRRAFGLSLHVDDGARASCDDTLCPD